MKKKPKHLIAWISTITNHIGHGSISFSLESMKDICRLADRQWPELVHAYVGPVQLDVLKSLSERDNGDALEYLKKVRNKM